MNDPSTLMGRMHQTVSHSYASLDDPDYLDAFVRSREERRVQLAEFQSEKVGQGEPHELISRVWNDCEEQWNQAPDRTRVFDPAHFLGSMLWTWKDGQRFSRVQTRALNLLQKRFEVHHRLFDRYDGEFRRQSDNFTDARVYILLAMALLLRFCERRNYNDLNTVLKLHDALINAGFELDTLCKRWLSLSLWFESQVLRRENAR